MKLALSGGLALAFCLPYFLLQRVALVPARTLPLTLLDRAIDFDPRWVWMYQSVYLLLAVVPWTFDPPNLHRYARGFLALSGVGFAFFLLLPVRGPRPDVEVADLMFRVLQWYDRPLNCFPSLHVGLAAYTALVAGTVWSGRLSPVIRRWALSLGWVWTALIAYAALATKQHYAVDLPAGALLACLCHWWIWRNAQRSLAHAERPLESPRLSDDPVGALLYDRDGCAAAGAAPPGHGSR